MIFFVYKDCIYLHISYFKTDTALYMFMKSIYTVLVFCCFQRMTEKVGVMCVNSLQIFYCELYKIFCHNGIIQGHTIALFI